VECGGLEIRTFAVAASSASVTLSVFARKAVNVLGRAVYEQTVTVLGPNSHRRVGGKTGSRLIWEIQHVPLLAAIETPSYTMRPRNGNSVVCISIGNTAPDRSNGPHSVSLMPNTCVIVNEKCQSFGPRV
jgi:hypothetical protein